jgi:hypothetical protein
MKRHRLPPTRALPLDPEARVTVIQLPDPPPVPVHFSMRQGIALFNGTMRWSHKLAKA